MIIAVDFDGTLCKDAYPLIGTPNKTLIDLLKNRKQRYNDSLILWTCRTGEHLKEALHWCEIFELHFDAVNENLPHIQREWGGDTRKVYADIYIDDKNRLVPW